MFEFLHTIKPESEGSEKLVQLIKFIRPPHPDRIDYVHTQLTLLISYLKENPGLAADLKSYLFKLLSESDELQMYTETGIMQVTGFFTEISNRFKHKFLSPLLEDNDLRLVLQQVFYKKNDYQWLQKTDPAILGELFDVLKLFRQGTEKTTVKEQLINAIVIISHRVTSMGLEHEIRDRIASVDELTSPFITQSYEVMSYLEKLRTVDVINKDSEDLHHILVLLSQCEEILRELKSNKQKFGVAVSMTFLMSRLQQNITRMRILLALLHASQEDISVLFSGFLTELVKADNLKNNVSHHINNNIGLMAYQVVEHAGRTGEHYITTNRKEYFKFWFASMKGGFIVGFLAVFKLLLYYLHLAPFWQALSYSVNYALGFVTIHISHSALATKQPAMTASRIATSLDKRSGGDVSMDEVVVLISRVTRSQLISLIGNLMICFPMGVLLAYLWKLLFGVHMADPVKAATMMHEVHPWQTLSLFYAALTGVYLFLSGLISGYFDNLLIYKNIAQRIRKHTGLRKLMKPKTLDRFCNYIEHNIGSIAGNIFLGIFLGFTSMLGFIFGLPIDIRHITFSAASYGIGLASADFNITRFDAFVAVLGIMGIGLMNFCFSFGLAFYTAMRSRGMELRYSVKMMSTLFKYIIRHPFEFIFPPGKTKVDSDVAPK